MPQIKSSFILEAPYPLDDRAVYNSMSDAEAASNSGIVPDGHIAWIASLSKHYKYAAGQWTPFHFDDMQYLSKSEMADLGSDSDIAPGQLAYCSDDKQIYYWAFDGSENASSSDETGWYLPLINITDSVYLKLEDAEKEYLKKEEASSKYQLKGNYVDSSTIVLYLTKEEANSVYLSKTQASSNYMSKTEGLTKAEGDSKYMSKSDGLTKTEASSTYLTIGDAGSIYVSQDDAEQTYLSKSEASSSYQPKGDYLTQSQASSLYASVGSVNGLSGDLAVLSETVTTNATNQDNINSSVQETLEGKASQKDLETLSASVSDISQSLTGVEGDVNTLKDAVKGGVHFKGVVTVSTGDINQDATGSYVDGDIIIYGESEYIRSGNEWVLLGDTTAEAQRLTDLEGAVEVIDGNLSTVSATVLNHTSSINGLDTRVETLEQRHLTRVLTKTEYNQLVKDSMIDENTIYFTYEE